MNNIYIIIFECSVSLFESYLMIDFISRFNAYKYEGLKKNVLFISSVFLVFLNVTAANYYKTSIEIPSYTALIIMSVYSIVALKGRVIVKLFSCVIINVTLILINSFSLFMFGLIFHVNIDDMINTFGIYRFVCLIVSKIILFYVSRIILKIKACKTETTPLSVWLLITVIPILTIFIMVTVTESAVYNNDTRITFYLMLSIIGLIFTNIIFYYLFMKVGMEYEIIAENELLKHNISLRNKHMAEIKNLYKEIRTMRHDMKNQLINIYSCIQDKNYEKGLKYINDITAKIDKTKKFVFTGNDMFNAIVNNKFTEANMKEIKISYSINYDLNGKIDDEDINILFGNLLDNAIEASEDTQPEKEIVLSIDKKRDYIFIEVKNTIDKSILKDNPNLLTTKHDKFNHGMGVRSIKNIVQKYDGIIDYHEEENIFCCDILLLEKN